MFYWSLAFWLLAVKRVIIFNIAVVATVLGREEEDEKGGNYYMERARSSSY